MATLQILYDSPLIQHHARVNAITYNCVLIFIKLLSEIGNEIVV